MGDYKSVWSKIVKWTEIKREPAYTAVLECGHEVPSAYEEPWDAAQKADIEARGETICIDCSREESELAIAEAKVRELKGRRKSKATQLKSEGKP